MKRLIVALLVGGMVFGTVLAVAASLIVEGGTIQAGSDTELRCDTNGVRVDGWGLESDNGLVYFVRIHDINTACEGDDLFVNITKDGAKIAGGSATIPADTDAAPDDDPDTGDLGVKVSFTPQPAEDITDIEIFIEGGP